MSITTALKARREALRDREAGFTLIELLVVVIIIGILAAIAIPIYVGVQNNAKDSAVKSDLVNGKTALAAYGTDNNGTLPGAYSVSALQKYGASQSSNTVSFTYSAPTTGTNNGLFCLIGKGSTNNYFMITSNTQIAGPSATAPNCPTQY